MLHVSNLVRNVTRLETIEFGEKLMELPCLSQVPTIFSSDDLRKEDSVFAKMLSTYKELLLSGKTFQTKQIRADTSHEVSALLVTLFTHPCESAAGPAGLLGDMVSPFRQRGWSLDETVKLGN